MFFNAFYLAFGHNVYERFGKGSPTHLRRRRLVLELSGITGDDGWVNRGDIPDLSPRLAREYSNKTAKTLSRDLSAVIEMELVESAGRRVRARKEMILAFLPAHTVSAKIKQHFPSGGLPARGRPGPEPRCVREPSW